MNHRFASCAFALLALAACGTIQIPEQRYYRLEPPRPAPAPAPRAGALRLGAVELAADLAGDRLIVAEQSVRVAPFVHHHWAGPLDRLIADALVTGLRRANWFERVKEPTASGDEQWVLHGRVLDFHLAPNGEGEWVGLATVDVELIDAQGALVFREEIRRGVAADGTEPEHVVRALSSSMAEVVTAIGERCERAGVFERPFAASPWR